MLHRTPALLKPLVHLLNKLIFGELNQNSTADILTGAMYTGIPGVLWFLNSLFSFDISSDVSFSKIPMRYSLVFFEVGKRMRKFV